MEHKHSKYLGYEYMLFEEHQGPMVRIVIPKGHIIHKLPTEYIGLSVKWVENRPGVLNSVNDWCVTFYGDEEDAYRAIEELVAYDDHYERKVFS